MEDFFVTTFITNGTLIVWCLYFGGEVIKFFFPRFNKKLIPFISLLFGVIFMVFWFPAARAGTPLEIRINRGLVYGLTATGLHQLIHNIIYWCKVQYYKHPNKDRRKDRKINI